MSLVLDEIGYKTGVGGFQIRDISLSLNSGSIGCLFGKTGCGKSTLLRMIAGLDNPILGKIFIDGRLVAGNDEFVPPELRNIGIVFQHPSLFPHKTVFENVAFGIKLEKGYRKKVEDVLNKLNIKKFAGKLPDKLSGGEQQLVTVARSIVHKPQLLLLDEPFSNLDLSLRRQMLNEVMSFLRENKITTLFVTHDPEEALDFSDQIFCLRSGKIVQNGSPREVYYSPSDTNLAGFFGMINCINGSINSDCLDCPLGKIHDRRVKSGAISVCVRPEAIVLSDEGVNATVQDVKFYNRMILINIMDNLYWMRFPIAILPNKGDKIKVGLDLDQIMFLNSYKKEEL